MSKCVYVMVGSLWDVLCMHFTAIYVNLWFYCRGGCYLNMCEYKQLSGHVAFLCECSTI